MHAAGFRLDPEFFESWQGLLQDPSVRGVDGRGGKVELHLDASLLAHPFLLF